MNTFLFQKVKFFFSFLPNAKNKTNNKNSTKNQLKILKNNQAKEIFSFFLFSF